MQLPSHSPARRRIEGSGTTEPSWIGSPHILDLEPAESADWAMRFARIWILAPHPDDEILALGGTLAKLSQQGADIRIISVTDGEASHRQSTAWSPERLTEVRPLEMLRGLGQLGVEAEVIRLGLPDGRVGAHRTGLLKTLAERVEKEDLLLATCRFDGHPDHEACGDVAVLAGELSGATVFEYPVWMWHWALPHEASIPWARAKRLPIDAGIVARKRAALDEFKSQVEPDGSRPPILPPHVLPRFLRPFEVVFT